MKDLTKEQQDNRDRLKSKENIGKIFVDSVAFDDQKKFVPTPIRNEINEFAKKFNIDAPNKEINAWRDEFSLMIREYAFTFVVKENQWKMVPKIEEWLDLVFGKDWQQAVCATIKLKIEELYDHLFSAYAIHVMTELAREDITIINGEKTGKNKKYDKRKNAFDKLFLSKLNLNQVTQVKAFKQASESLGQLHRAFAQERQPDAAYRKKRPEPNKGIKNHLAYFDRHYLNMESIESWVDRYLNLCLFHLCTYVPDSCKLKKSTEKWMSELLGKEWLEKLLSIASYKKAGVTKEIIYCTLVSGYASDLFMSCNKEKYDPPLTKNGSVDPESEAYKKHQAGMKKLSSVNTLINPDSVASILKEEHKKRLSTDSPRLFAKKKKNKTIPPPSTELQPVVNAHSSSTS